MKRFRFTSANAPQVAATAIAALVAVMIVGGCATAKAPQPSRPAPELQPGNSPATEPKPVQSPTPVPQARAQPVPATPAPPAVDTNAMQPVPGVPEHLSIRIETHPQGAMILVDGRPVGRSPLDVVVDTANNGFFKNPVTIRARFVATDENSETFSVDGQFGPLERVPLALVFSKAGVQRILRQF